MNKRWSEIDKSEKIKVVDELLNSIREVLLDDSTETVNVKHTFGLPPHFYGRNKNKGFSYLATDICTLEIERRKEV